MPAGGPLLTVRDGAAQLRVHSSRVYALCERGKLPHVRVSNALRITSEDLQAYIAASRRV